MKIEEFKMMRMQSKMKGLKRNLFGIWSFVFLFGC